MQHRYYRNERCTYWMASDIMHRSEHTARRYLTRLRKQLGLPKKSSVTVEQFCTHYGFNILYAD